MKKCLVRIGLQKSMICIKLIHEIFKETIEIKLFSSSDTLNDKSEKMVNLGQYIENDDQVQIIAKIMLEGNRRIDKLCVIHVKV